jgi:hypothetical protein
MGEAANGTASRWGENYEGGKWIEITYGRPLKRGRNLWGSGVNYGKDASVGTPIWRAGANVTTRLATEAVRHRRKNGRRRLLAVFIDLKGEQLDVRALHVAGADRG